ncbi:MAG TPA: ATP-binding protein [Solirubrobacteraceae bacterium]|nr:ATP-binding protein [Solirubrobacteraceae bacterium]
MRGAPVALVAAGVWLGIASVQASYEPGETGAAIADLGVGWVLMGCGLVAWVRRRESRAGLLMAAVGAAWLLGSLLSPALYLHRGPLVHLLLSYPSGRLTGRRDHVVVIVVYLVAAIEPLARSPVVTLAVCATVAVTAVGGYLRETGARRRMRAAPAAGATAVALVLALGSIGRLAGWDSAGITLVAYEIVLATVAAALLTDLLRGRWSEGAVTGLVVELGEASQPVTLRERLARAVSDPSLQLGYRVGGVSEYVDEAGRPLALPGPGAERVVTPVDSDGERVAVLVHDRAVLDDPVLVEAIAAATRIAVTNVRLRSEVAARVEQIAASRRRIAEAADAQRSRLQRELHDGAERRLVAMSEHVEALSIDVDESRARHLLGSVEEQLRAARRELGELALGIRPPALTNGGLAAALPELARRAPIAVDVRVDADRCRAAIEAAAYFVCAEALTNVAKYAQASRASVNVEHDGERLTIAIADDGVGGADPSRGSGLRGLTDRVEALGGRLDIDSPRGEGTRLVAELPSG